MKLIRWMTRSKKRGVFVVMSLAVLVAATTALAAWFVTSSGTAGGRIASLTPPTVTAVHINGAVYPGGVLDLKADVLSLNDNTLAVTTTSATGPATTGNATCDASLATMHTSYQDEITSAPIEPGANPGIQLGTITLPAEAATECQGLDLTVPVSVTFSTP